MRTLNTRQEIAATINFKKMTVVTLDLAKADEYGLVSEPVQIDNGTFRDGEPYYIHSVIRAYTDERKFTFTQYGCCISASFTYSDMEEILAYANAPVVKKDADVCIAIIDSNKKQVYKPIILHTKDHISQHCSTPLTFADEDNDATMYLLLAGCKPREKACV